MADHQSSGRDSYPVAATYGNQLTSLLPARPPIHAVPSLPQPHAVPSVASGYGVPSLASGYGVPSSRLTGAQLDERELDGAWRMQQAAQAYNTARYLDALRYATGIQGKCANMAELARAITLGELARYDESLFAFAVYLVKNGQDAMAWNSYGSFLCSLGHRDLGEQAHGRALGLVDVALQSTPTDVASWQQKSEALLGLWHAEEALSAAMSGLALDEQDALLTQQRGRAHHYLSQWPQAKAWLTRAIALDAYDPYARYYLTKVLAQLGDEGAAEPHFRYFKSVSPHLSAISSADLPARASASRRQ